MSPDKRNCMNKIIVRDVVNRYYDSVVYTFKQAILKFCPILIPLENPYVNLKNDITIRMREN